MNLRQALFVTLLIATTWTAISPAFAADEKYQNPILFADYSDPDVIRVGSYFYLVSSSFHLMPGIPVLKSPDLVNWTIVGHVFSRLDISKQYNMEDGNRYGHGCWAPAIRYHNNRFYVYFPTPDEGIFMSSAPAAEGPWDPITAVINKPKLEDPCPFWDDDGTAYLIHSLKGAGPLILHKMSADGKSVLDDGTVVVKDAKRLPVLEGPKLYKRNGYYFIFAPIGGVEKGTQVVLRAKNIYGPYESKVVLAQGTTAINGPHQGGYVETLSGQGWFVHFQERDGYGRITHLEPVKWVNDWPVLGQPIPDAKGTAGQPVLSWPKPDMPGDFPPQSPQDSDEFDKPALGLQWQWNHNPVDDQWSLRERPGWLRLHALPAKSLLEARNTLTQMIFGPTDTAKTLLDNTAMTSGQRAGLAIFCDRPSWIGVACTQGKRRITLFDDGRETVGPELAAGTIQLQVSVTDGIFHFSYSTDGSTFIPLGAPGHLRFGWWQGSRFALFSFNAGPDSSNGGTADFDYFHASKAPAAKTP